MSSVDLGNGISIEGSGGHVVRSNLGGRRGPLAADFRDRPAVICGRRRAARGRVRRRRRYHDRLGAGAPRAAWIRGATSGRTARAPRRGRGRRERGPAARERRRGVPLAIRRRRGRARTRAAERGAGHADLHARAAGRRRDGGWGAAGSKASSAGSATGWSRRSACACCASSPVRRSTW